MKKKLLSIILSMLMLISILPTSAFTVFAEGDSTAVVKIGETKYDTLQAAIDVAQEDDVITLSADLKELGTEVEAGSGEYFVQILDKAVEIDLGGNTFKGSIYLNSGATLNIDNGNIQTLEGNKSSSIESVGGSIVLGEKVNVYSSVRHAIRVKGGEAVINGGNHKADGNSTYHVVNISHAANVEINGGTFTSNKGNSTSGGNALMVQDAASIVDIYGGTFQNAAGVEGCICAAAGLTIYGGTFDTWTYDNYLAEELVLVEQDGKFFVYNPREFVVKANKSTVLVGEEVEVTVTLNGIGIDLIGAEWTLDYDDAKFELVDTTLTNSDRFVFAQDGSVVINGVDPFDESQQLATYTFKAIMQEVDEQPATFTVIDADAWTIEEATGNIVVDAAITSTEVTVLNPKMDSSAAGSPTIGGDCVVVVESEFVAGKKLVLVHSNALTTFKYDDKPMYKVEGKYGKEGYAHTFAIVVDAIENGDQAAYGDKVKVVYQEITAEYTLTYDENDFDLNDSTNVDLRDVSVAYSVLNKNAYTYANYMNIVLNADINANGIVDGEDMNAFVTAYQDAINAN